MTLPTSEPLLDDPSQLPPARRRRGRRSLIPQGSAGNDERAVFLDGLARRATPSLDFFLFALLSGFVLSAGLVIDSPAVLVLGAAVAPFLGPLIGLSLAAVVGSGRFFLRSFAGLALAAALIFGAGYATGMAARLWPGLPLPLTQALAQTHGTWIVGGALAAAYILSVLVFVRTKGQEPALIFPGAALAYFLFLPLAASGIGLATGEPRLFPAGLLLFVVFLSACVLVGIVTLGLLGLRPRSLIGYSLGTTIVLCSLTGLIGLGGVWTVLHNRAAQPTPAQAISAAPVGVGSTPIGVTAPPSPAQGIQPAAGTPAAATATPPGPTRTATAPGLPTHTLIPSPTVTITISPVPTPVWAMIYAQSFNGAFIRAEPKSGAKIVISQLNGTLVEVLSDIAKEGNVLWAHVRTVEGQEGWIVQSLLVTATPAPGW